tara:strand:- start:1 stop:162 length:162 start_codon:yes stop_codon:yes gene_type:complete
MQFVLIIVVFLYGFILVILKHKVEKGNGIFIIPKFMNHLSLILKRKFKEQKDF